MAASTQRDNHILDLIFNPGSHPAPPTVPLPEQPEESVSSKAVAALTADQESQMRQHEAKGIKLAEAGQPVAAVDQFTLALAICDKYASLYNNRAQALRLLGKNDEALADLNRAIEYGTGEAFVLKQAYTQRAVLYKAMGNQDAALADFETAGKLGSDVARVAAVRENPFAQMCNAIMDQVMAPYKQALASSNGAAAPPATKRARTGPCTGENEKHQ
ncbi:Tetratricopeptide repeat protein 36 [Allomyces javanicus]|nr:Tetratricopeptide repeat protein 36 [Allomyces javanicus]